MKKVWNKIWLQDNSAVMLFQKIKKAVSTKVLWCSQNCIKHMQKGFSIKLILKQNLEAAINVFIGAVNGSLCGGKPIQLIKGAQDELSTKYQERRKRLIIFLCHTKKKKMEVKIDYPYEYKYFSKVSDLQEHHMVPNLPFNCVCMLCLCYQKDCIHLA